MSKTQSVKNRAVKGPTRGGKSVKSTPSTVVDTKVIALEKINLLKEHRLRVKEDAKTINRYAEVWSQYLEDKRKDA